MVAEVKRIIFLIHSYYYLRCMQMCPHKYVLWTAHFLHLYFAFLRNLRLMSPRPPRPPHKPSLRQDMPTCWKKKVWFYIALYPVHWTAQSALHFPPLADLFIPTPFSASLGSILAMQQLRNDYSLTFPPLSIARYSFIQLSRLRRREVKENAQTSKRYQRGSNPGSLDCESGILPLSHRAPHQQSQWEPWLGGKTLDYYWDQWFDYDRSDLSSNLMQVDTFFKHFYCLRLTRLIFNKS